MPQIELIEPVFYTANDPIHWEVDNLPLKNILTRQRLINSALDNVIEELRDAIGTQGSVANRLNQSMNSDGSLKSSAIDDALHTMDDHTDTDDYVRMTKEQSDKLDLIQEEATDITLTVYTDDTTFVDFETGPLIFKPSSTVTPVIDSPNIISFTMAFPEEAAHRHYYGLVPVDVSLVTPDHINFKVNSMATAFVEGTLRVYINGVRIFEGVDIYVPGPLPEDAWSLMSFEESHTNGRFELSSAITEDDVIRIDFEISLA